VITLERLHFRRCCVAPASLCGRIAAVFCPRYEWQVSRRSSFEVAFEDIIYLSPCPYNYGTMIGVNGQTMVVSQTPSEIRELAL
jgi:hypothetical protein